MREALKCPNVVVEIFATADAMTRNPDVMALIDGQRVDEISQKAAAGLSETVSPQGLVAVCETIDRPLGEALARAPKLVAVLVDANDPGNAGTILRTADAAGADAVVLAGDSVDIYNGKAVRATAGSLFHVDVVQAGDPIDVIDQCRTSGLLTLATTGHSTTTLDELIDNRSLAKATAWLFGNEARGLDETVLAHADTAVSIPIHGGAESLNIGAAAAVCLYASARSQRS